MTELDRDTWLTGAMQIPSTNFDSRPSNSDISLLVIHSISLPPHCYGGPGVTSLFTNAIDPDVDGYFSMISALRVSAHAFIRRDGGLVQYVPFAARAWHAGVSSWQGRERCNDFSIGIELEGSDDSTFTEGQYASLSRLVDLLLRHYPITHVVGHSDIAPGRKTDPGPFFDWLHLSLSCNTDKRVAMKK